MSSIDCPASFSYMNQLRFPVYGSGFLTVNVTCPMPSAVSKFNSDEIMIAIRIARSRFCIFIFVSKSGCAFCVSYGKSDLKISMNYTLK